MYVVPVYAARVQSSSSSYLTLRYVMVSYNSKVGIGDTLVDAITDMTGTSPPPSTGNLNGNGNGNKTLTLVDGDTFSNPGQMFQYLRTRTDAAAGNPKAIVNAYPNSFDNVGDLIQQKRDATGQ